MSARLCGATSKRTGRPCKGKAMPNGRCRLHGGKSTGPKTAEGRRRIALAQLQHGNRSREGIAATSASKQVRAALELLLACELRGEVPPDTLVEMFATAMKKWAEAQHALDQLRGEKART